MKKIILLALAAAATFGIVHAISPKGDSSVKSSGPFRGHAREVIVGIFGELKALRADIALTDGQRSQIQDVVKQHQSEIAGQFERGRDARRAMREAVEKSGPESAEAVKAADGIAEAARSRALFVGKVSSEIAPILTDEQRGKVKATREHIEDSIDSLLGKFGE